MGAGGDTGFGSMVSFALGGGGGEYWPSDCADVEMANQGTSVKKLNKDPHSAILDLGRRRRSSRREGLQLASWPALLAKFLIFKRIVGPKTSGWSYLQIIRHRKNSRYAIRSYTSDVFVRRAINHSFECDMPILYDDSYRLLNT